MENLSFTGIQLLIAIAAIGIQFLVGLIFFRSTFNKMSFSFPSNNPLSFFANRNKYLEADAFKWRNTIWIASLAIALLVSILAFSWTSYDQEAPVEYLHTLDEQIIDTPPPTAHPPPPLPPPPPPPKKLEITIDPTELEEAPVFLDEVVMENPLPPPPIIKKELAPPPPPPKVEEPDLDINDIFTLVEQAPRFPGCEDMTGDNKTKKACADKAMLQFIYQNIEYPAIARENGIEGTVVVRFVVEKDGTIQHATIVRDIGGGCGAEGLRVVNLMNTLHKIWTPGKQRDKAVRVQFNLPIKYQLN